MEAEMKTLEENGTWIIVKKPVNSDYIDSKWIFKRKHDENENIVAYKISSQRV